MSPSLSHPLAPRPEATGLETRKFTVTFTTPAFLGGANQSAQWRTPPFKALLREWWRVAYTASQPKHHTASPNWHQDLRKAEAEILGHAVEDADRDGNASRRSLVRLRLDQWKAGTRKTWYPDPKVTHPEVTMQIGAHLYLGYGPLTFANGTALNQRDQERTAIEPGTQGELTVSVPPAHAAQVWQAVNLANWFGTLGSRSRNGWGSFALAGLGIEPKVMLANVEPLESALKSDWTRAIGGAWRSRATYANWQEAMKAYAELKIALRTGLKFARNNESRLPLEDDLVLEPRHLLAYPVTNHGVKGWGKVKQGRRGPMFAQDFRIAGQLRAKIAPAPIGGLEIRVVHLPCGLPKAMAERLPPAMRPNSQQELTLWTQVQAFLNQNLEPIQ